MAAVELNRLIDRARVRLPGALDSQLQAELFDVMDQFFRGSMCWTEEIEFTTRADVVEYDVVPTNAEIVRLIGVRRGASADEPPGSAVGATMPEIGTVRLASMPSTAETMTATVANTVTNTNRDGYPSFPLPILKRYGTRLLHGLLARMMSQPAKPYSSAALATFHQKAFNALISDASVDAQHQNTYRAQNWRFPSF